MSDKETDPVGDVEPDEDEDEFDDDEFDEDLVVAAKTVGLDPGDFENENELYRATRLELGKATREGAAEKSAEPEKLELASLVVELANKGELDEGLVSNLEELAKATGENFSKLAERIQAGASGDQALTKRLDGMSAQIASLGAQNVQLRLDRWIAKNEQVQKYLGKGDTGDLNDDSKFVKRRRALIRRADRASHFSTNFTMEGMFSKAFKKMHTPPADAKGKAEGKEKETVPTRMARASGSKSTDFVSGDESEAAIRREAADVIRKCRRNAK